MKLFIDRKNRRFVKSAASNVALDRLVLKRRDLVPLEVVFVENGAVVATPSGTTITAALKRNFSDTNFLAVAESGTLNLNTVALEAAFASSPACSEWDAAALNNTGRCAKCGCSTWAKLRMATERCPLGKWEPVLTDAKN